MTTTADMRDDVDGAAAWWRLAASVLLATLGGAGLWSSVVVLPAIEVEFGLDRGGASLPYFATMIGHCNRRHADRADDRSVRHDAA